MSIKPIDLQVMIPRMPEVAKYHGSEAARQHLAAQQGMRGTQQKAEADVKEVHKKEDVYKVIPADEKDKKERMDSKQGKKNRQNRRDGGSGAEGRTEDGKNDDGGVRSIDIKL